MNASSDSSSGVKTSLIVVCLAGALFLLFSHYAVVPDAGLHMDDWSYVGKNLQFDSYRSLFDALWRHPHRPVGYLYLLSVFRLFGMNPAAFALMGLATYALCAVLLVLFAYQMTGNKQTAMLTVLCFALFPNMSEAYHWPNMIVINSLVMFYLLSAWFWVLFVQKREARYLVASVIAFSVGLGSYEVGLFLPVAYAVMLEPKKGRAQWLWLLPFLVADTFYLAWRFTNVFGLGTNIMYSTKQFGVEISPWLAKHNFINLASWWLGPNMFASIQNGLAGFAQIPGSGRHMFVVSCLAVIALVVLYTRQLSGEKPDSSSLSSRLSSNRVIVFGLVWAAATSLLCAISYTAQRLNFLPGIGLALCLAAAIGRLKWRYWISAYCLLAFVGLIANQGTAYTWKKCGVLQQRLFEHLSQHQAEWSGKQVILFDTQTLRQESLQSHFLPVIDPPSEWAYYGNASLLRGLVPYAMVDILATHSGKQPAVALDTETDAHLGDGVWHWHDRYDPSRPHSTPLDQVFVVDCLRVSAWEP